jgi:ribosomal protein L30/L7E
MMRFIEVEQIGSPIRRHHSQRECLVGLGLNRIGRVKWVPDMGQIASGKDADRLDDFRYGADNVNVGMN